MNTENKASQEQAPIQSGELTPASERSVEYMMEAVQCFASEWSLLGGKFDKGQMLGQAEETKARIRRMLEDDARRLAAVPAAQQQAQSVPAGWKVERLHEGRLGASHPTHGFFIVAENDDNVRASVAWLLLNDMLAAAPTPPAATPARSEVEELQAKLEESEEARVELVAALNRELGGDTFMGEPVLPPRPNVSAMVNRFLGWKLPQDFAPDCGVSFTALGHPNGWPVGTNLLTAEQAQAMFLYCLATPQGERETEQKQGA